MKRIAKITEIDPVMSKCISVNSDTKLFRIGDEIIHIKDNKTNTNNEQEIDKKIQHITESIYGKQRTKDTQTNKKTLTNNVTNTIKKAVKTPYNAIKNTTQTNTPQDIILYDGQQIDLKQVLESDYNPLQGNTPQNVYALRKKGFVTHNSVLQRSIIFACILRPKSWYFAGIDLKKVELTPYVVYSNVVLGVAMTLENAVEVLRFAQQTMMSRYEALTQMGLKNFLDMPGENRALLVMVDEYGEAASPTGSKTDEGKEADNMKGEVQMMVGSIARLGRAAGVHLVVATQRPDAKLLPGETKANLGVRINCGYTNSTASSMILDNAEGTKVKPSPKGRFYIQIYSQGNHGQAFFAKEDWMDKYLDSHGLNQDGTPKGSNADSIAAGKEAGLELTEAEGSEYARPEDDWDDELEDLIDENEE